MKGVPPVRNEPTILCYHRISRRPLPAGTWVGPGQLARQLDALQIAGVRFLSPDEYYDLIAGLGVGDVEPRLPAGTGPQVLLTFDDGTVDLHQHRDILAGRGIRPLVFMPAAFVGRPNSWELPVPGRRVRHLSAVHLRELAAAGWEIGLHGACHCDLTRLSDSRLAAEVSLARVELQEVLGRPVRFFSYPYGRVTARVVEQVRGAGFAAAFVLAAPRSGPSAEDLFRLARRPVYFIDSARDVLAKVEDPFGRTLLGRWQHWKERSAHGVGRWFAGRSSGGGFSRAGDPPGGQEQQIRDR